jgi:hypothetical protein
LQHKMTKIKLEHIDNLRRGKKSWAKIGSRWVPHHLLQYEQIKYDRALKYKYLEVSEKDRVNLKNLWQKVCIAKSWKNYTLVKNTEFWTARILLNDKEMDSGIMKNMKLTIKKYV